MTNGDLKGILADFPDDAVIQMEPRTPGLLMEQDVRRVIYDDNGEAGKTLTLSARLIPFAMFPKADV